MCYCTPNIRTPFCDKCASLLFKEVLSLNEELRDVKSSMIDVKQKTLEHSAQYFDLLDETFPMTPPQIAASIRQQAKAIQ